MHDGVTAKTKPSTPISGTAHAFAYAGARHRCAESLHFSAFDSISIFIILPMLFCLGASSLQDMQTLVSDAMCLQHVQRTWGYIYLIVLQLLQLVCHVATFI